MRCALRYDPAEEFVNQTVSAWGEMQSLNEEPSYKETDLNRGNRTFFRGYKMAMDEAVASLRNALFDYTDEDTDDSEILQGFIENVTADICMALFSLLDEQMEMEDEKYEQEAD